MGIWQEMLEKTSDEAQAQWADNDVDDYKYRIQSCYNCRKWCKDITLMGDYAWNTCKDGRWIGACGMRFDACCPDYIGFMKEPNVTFIELWEKGIIDWAKEETKRRKGASGDDR